MARLRSGISVLLVCGKTDINTFLESKYLAEMDELDVIGTIASYDEIGKVIKEKKGIEAVLFNLLGDDDVESCMNAAEQIHALKPFCKIVILYDGKAMSWTKNARKKHVDGIWNPQVSRIGLVRLMHWVMKDEIVYAGEDAFFEE